MSDDVVHAAQDKAALRALEVYAQTFEAELNKAGLTTSQIRNLPGSYHEHKACLADPNTETAVLVVARWTFEDVTQELRESIARKASA
jgi:hypothetical protein